MEPTKNAANYTIFRMIFFRGGGEVVYPLEANDHELGLAQRRLINFSKGIFIFLRS